MLVAHSPPLPASRAAVSPQIIEDYFIQLQNSTVGVPLGNIENYDESNLADDPGQNKILTKRGVKYPERVMNHTKWSTSLMLAASADGRLLPCYVVYKAVHLYNTWTTNGPPNCRYNRTSSGWFDGNTFEDWVETVALPYFNIKTGIFFLIHDNLSSHLSLDIIKKMSITGCTLCVSSTKLSRRVLPTIPKNDFPKLLNKMLEKMEPNIKQNILAGFMKAGIRNHTRHEFSTEEKEAIDESVLSLLKEMRYGSLNTDISSAYAVSDIEPNQPSKKIKRGLNKTTNKNPTNTEKENIIAQVPNLNTKRKDTTGKKSKPLKEIIEKALCAHRAMGTQITILYIQCNLQAGKSKHR
ncbi:hypothetical protein K1T71_012946 [Dendrolimus kikuchii]|uniref:Uncharacterized protein n=1 Tax=Dendrolimus kikuchii TaxID=765133 RepID=A0ACC1CIQ2_9NEOP|nr:hypothetical protein K1T71_012946 [Dendrolimus kikuchii]